ncbi:MAG: ABC transporter permease, partial [Acholeplasmataceae bacterium]|nr:ABC transporter permease [Acholeplasmataceae bacterium]
MANLYFIIQKTMYFVIPLLIVALGGMFSEKSGIINIALEGIMVIGAFFGIFFINAMQAGGVLKNHPQILLVLAVLVSGLAGSLYSSLLAFASINMKADQTIGGTALNLLATAFVVFFARTMNNVKQIYFSQVFMIRSVPIFGKIPFIGNLFFTNTFITTFIGVLVLLIAIIVLKKTRFGLRLSACGEHPQAAQSVGVNVYRMRWSGVLISGLLGGIGGLTYVIPTQVSFSGDVAGYGFLALAVMIFGQWKPGRIFFAALFFGFFKALSVTYFKFDFINNLRIPNASYLFKMIPFIATMIALAFTSK